MEPPPTLFFSTGVLQSGHGLVLAMIHDVVSPESTDVEKGGGVCVCVWVWVCMCVGQNGRPKRARAPTPCSAPRHSNPHNRQYTPKRRQTTRQAHEGTRNSVTQEKREGKGRERGRRRTRVFPVPLLHPGARGWIVKLLAAVKAPDVKAGALNHQRR